MSVYSSKGTNNKHQKLQMKQLCGTRGDFDDNQSESPSHPQLAINDLSFCFSWVNYVN